MIKAVLLDLDNTLLINPNEAVVTEYLRRVDAFFEERWNLSRIAKALIAGVKKVTGERDARRTNSDLMLEAVSEATGRSPADVVSLFATFYAEEYANLQDCTTPIDMAPILVDNLLAQGYQVIVATNPLYPEVAIHQRLAWANLGDRLDQFAFITHADGMHFAKPQPEYYAEILGYVGVEPGEAIMVGDDINNDIIPAAQVGLHTYHIMADGRSEAPNTGGSLNDFYGAITNGWLDMLEMRPHSADMIAPQLWGNIGTLHGILSQVQPHYWMQHPDPNEWSLMQIVCHLLESETTVQRPRLQRILHEDNPFLKTPKDPPGPETEPCDTDGYRVANLFAEERRKTLVLLDTLTPEQWARPARHNVFGLTTLLEMAHFTAQHDRLHLNQLCQTLGNCE